MVTNKKELNVIGEFILPTKKLHVSYSEVSDWMDCSYRHKLKHVDKIILDSGSIHTAFGSAIHDAAEQFLLTGKMPATDEVIKVFVEHLKKLDTPEDKKAALKKDAIEFSKEIEGMLEQIPPFMKETFGDYEVISAEEMLYEDISSQPGVKFKGFLDAVIKTDKKRGKGKEYHILDWKTTSWGWMAKMKRSFQKQLQIMLYKKFFSEKHNVPLSDIKCGFVLIKRKPGKDGNRMELITVSAGDKAIEKAENQLDEMITQIKQGRVVKNRFSCKPFCPYLRTPHCL